MTMWQQSAPVIKKHPREETFRLLRAIHECRQATKSAIFYSYGGDLTAVRRKIENAAQAMLIYPVGSVTIDGRNQSIYKLTKKGFSLLGLSIEDAQRKERHDTRGQPFYGIQMRSARVDAEQALSVRSVGLLSDRVNGWR
jgi:hypothetical protein